MENKMIESLYTQHFDELKAFAYAMCQSPEDAEDIVSQVFTEILENAGNLELNYPKQYLYRATHNRTIDHYRKKAQRADAYSECLPDQDECQEYPELHNAIKDLPDRQAMAIYLFYWKHMSYEQIAIEMGCTCQAVHRLLDKAKGKLRELMTNG